MSRDKITLTAADFLSAGGGHCCPLPLPHDGGVDRKVRVDLAGLPAAAAESFPWGCGLQWLRGHRARTS